MIGFSYTYELPATLSGNASLTLPGIIGGVIGIVIALGGIFVVLPTLYMSYNYHLREKHKKVKKRMLNQILIQQQIENEVEQEIKIEDDIYTKKDESTTPQHTPESQETSEIHSEQHTAQQEPSLENPKHDTQQVGDQQDILDTPTTSPDELPRDRPALSNLADEVGASQKNTDIVSPLLG